MDMVPLSSPTREGRTFCVEEHLGAGTLDTTFLDAGARQGVSSAGCREDDAVKGEKAHPLEENGLLSAYLEPNYRMM
jgi:hypothetical protein